ncbi:P1 family peptidase [Bordetella holmesii]|uniref:Peptidase family T4 n=2 Tax=Bordetella holmesii TaxID=35814 RepID=A0A158M540_9BORD|nr:P1 family peptidase [Bordetella holmesii]AHV94879.1 peptidase S58 family protein [Bordetella holmesii ATCC 51541]AIT27006.1 peptidase S58 family protein [Bordetella holmesii 44057]EWM43130.1 peptidase S58 family protein [Bordetella holmesii 41130]EWM47590.1 peptidase S58 family protein [Bordetella holmesii 35009]EWM51757.1 peptidase S58 family protein [Bordetella holmesii 70147]
MTTSDKLPELPRIGTLQAGARDAITDVAGIRVGHATRADGDCQTGVTVLWPHGGDPYRDKVPAAASIINGFGKSVGLVQVQELGVLETPIALTNTFGVGTVANAQIRQAIAANPSIGREWATVNPLVFECNDGYLNNIQTLAITEDDYHQAYAAAAADFAQGSVGAGRGMSSFSFKGGIGSASRLARLKSGASHMVGALVLSNFGRLPLMTIAGRPFGQRLARRDDHGPEKGSIILILATDAALDSRQLGRLSLRAGAGLARTGSVFGHGSGDIALAFSTAYTVPHEAERAMPTQAMLHEAYLDPLFEAAAEACEQAIVSALWRAQTVHGRDGHFRRALPEVIPDWRQWLADRDF